jgi:hypothetical protein
MIKSTLTIALTTAAFGLVATSPAHAFGCPSWICGDNGTQLTGVAVQALKVDGIELKRVEVVIPKSGKAS